MDFYDRQINRVEQNDALREFDRFIEDYISSNDRELTRTIKELIISKARNELNQRELRAFRDNLSHRIKLEEWGKKLKLYELTLRLYNIENESGSERIWTIESSETLDFAVSWWYIERNYRSTYLRSWETRRRNDRYEIVWSSVRHLWDRLYEINLEWITSNRRHLEEKVLIRYTWWNTVEIFDPKRPSRSLWIVPIRNRSQTVERWRVHPDWRFHRITEDRNISIDFSINDNFWTNIHLELIFNDR